MGVFGPGIFADDDALDVRDEYKHILADEQSDEKATDAIAQQYGASFEDPAATTGFWLGLALTQWKMGRLDARVREIALRIVDEGIDLKKWEGSPLASKRAAALRKARQQIASPQPACRAIPKPLPVQLPGWEFGEVIGVHTADRLALLHMIAYRRCTQYQVKAPVVSILNWTRPEMPSAAELEALTYINWRGIQCGNHIYNLASPKRSPIRAERFLRLGVKKPVTRNEAMAAYGSLSRGQSLDALLREVLQPYWDNPTLAPHNPGFDKADRPR